MKSLVKGRSGRTAISLRRLIAFRVRSIFDEKMKRGRRVEVDSTIEWMSSEDPDVSVRRQATLLLGNRGLS